MALRVSDRAGRTTVAREQANTIARPLAAKGRPISKLMRNSLRLVPWLILAAGLGPVARAEGVVVSSTAPGVAVGQVVGDDETLHLPADSITVVLLATGQVVKLAGPYDGKAASGGPGEGAKTVLLEDWQRPDLSSLGGARGRVMPNIPPFDSGTPVVVDASTSGTWCIDPHTPVRLAAPATPAVVHLQDGAAETTIAWPPADGDQPWPAAMPPHDGATVLARWGDSATPLILRFRAPAGNEANPSSRLIDWWRAGCQRQVEPQLRAIGSAVTPFALFLSTDRGRTPRYGLGEPVNLIVRANRAAQLYCFVLQDGQVRSVFPGQPGRKEIPEQTEVHITADSLPVDITAPPPRLAELRCYAVADTAADAAKVQWPVAGARSEQSGSELDRVFAVLPETDVAQAHLTVRTE
jgi:hypothetical protein